MRYSKRPSWHNINYLQSIIATMINDWMDIHSFIVEQCLAKRRVTQHIYIYIIYVCIVKETSGCCQSVVTVPSIMWKIPNDMTHPLCCAQHMPVTTPYSRALRRIIRVLAVVWKIATTFMNGCHRIWSRNEVVQNIVHIYWNLKRIWIVVIHLTDIVCVSCELIIQLIKCHSIETIWHMYGWRAHRMPRGPMSQIVTIPQSDSNIIAIMTILFDW